MRNRKTGRTLAGLALLATAALSACGPAASPTPEPTSIRPLRPTFTPTVIPTDTPVPTDTPIPTDTPTPLPTDTPTPEIPKAVVIGEEQSNLRAGPGTNYDTVGQVERGAELEIVAKNAAGDWYQVCCVGDQQGWIVARLVEVRGDANLVQVAANIPAPPTNTPVPTRPPAAPRPTTPPAAPAPTATPASAMLFDKYQTDTRPNSNPIITFFAGLYTADLKAAVGTGYSLRVEGPNGGEAAFRDLFEFGDPGLPSQFIYNAKLELPPVEGAYRAYVVDSSGKQVSEAWEFTAAGETRIFLPRWKKK